MDESLAMAGVAAVDPTLGNSSGTEAKQSDQWLMDPIGPLSFSSVKQETQPFPSNFASWEGAANFRSIHGQYKLFAPENMRPMDFDGRKGGRFEDNHDMAVGLSISQCGGATSETGPSFNGVKKLKMDMAGDSGGGIRMGRTTPLHGVGSLSFLGSLADNPANEMAFTSMGSAWRKSDTSANFLASEYEEQIQFRPVNSTYQNEAAGVVSVYDPFRGEINVRSFGGYDKVEPYGQLSQIKESDGKNLLDAPVGNVTRAAKPRGNSTRKNKSEAKPLKKEAQNNFPANVRNLISTGILDGVPVKYVSSSREKLRGVIKGSGYLCGCRSCGFTKVLSSFEFERHAGCKTKHPNNRIFFENGKTIYQIVLELRSTPEEMLIDTVQTMFGSTINQNSFRIWKESYLAATHELHRIYGK
ncbi:hypothetical protein MLD38_003986 [Melastoma candidum]|uniref:Uncharacterized protein n=1 Tax=Melastoma candidum TaxID=119954 RepID=A0ACB9S3R9_9MYRT|nr:hypothetical protein MLD38_003986 [Melastoma candidum]